MSANELFNSLLRPAVIHILRAAGFHATKPSVLDVLTDLTARHLMLLAERTAYNAYSNHNGVEPDITDVRMAMQDCGVLVPTLTAAEETWREKLRKPLEEYPERNGLRAKERMRRDAEDTQDVRDFIEWVHGDQYQEIKRVAGLVSSQGMAETTAELDATEMEDYLTTLMKKHSKTGVEARFQGTVLGHPADPKPTKIEGGPAESIEDWCKLARERARNEAAEAALHSPATTVKDEDVGMGDASEEVTQDVSTSSTVTLGGDPTQSTSMEGTQDATGDVTQEVVEGDTRTSAQDNSEDVSMET